MNPRALAAVEFRACLEHVARRATSQLGREAILALEPGSAPDIIAHELERVAELVRALRQAGDLTVPEVPDAREALRRLKTAGSALDPAELHALGILLASARTLRSQRRVFASELPRLADLLDQLHENRRWEEAIARAIGPDGTVLDTASPELGRLRLQIQRLRLGIVRRLENYLRTVPPEWVVPDASVSIRDGRYVIPIRRERRRAVGGIIHGESQSGNTLFVEPPPALDLMNELSDIEAAEAREVHRILLELSDGLRPAEPELAASLDALVTFDSLYGRARYSLEVDGHVPTLLPPGTPSYTVVAGRHPLLLAGGARVVPFDLRLESDERAIVVSGPNTGGKSVLLKAVGLLSALTQSGIIPPVGPGTQLPVFTEIFADIGDEQSVARSLSTFSAHLGNLKEIVEHAGPTSLVLVDEIGTGTDPAEGAALASAIIVELARRGSMTVVTSHLGALKRLAGPGTGIVNVSLQFDPDRIEPTYLLVKGRPGRSYGLAMARRLGFPAQVVAEAEAHRPVGEAEVEELLGALERKEKEAAQLLDSLAAQREELTRLEQELSAREAEVKRRETALKQEGRRQARTFLLAARVELEVAIAEVRRAIHASDVEEMARRARRRLEDAIQAQAAGAIEEAGARGGTGTVAFVRPGERVRIAAGGAKGTVVEYRDGRAVVETAGIRVDVPVSELAPLGESEAAAPAGESEPTRGGWSGPPASASPEVDLRGLRVDDVEQVLSRAIDDAVLADLPSLRIIHGMGTGALRERVRQLLGVESRIRTFRPGRRGEGGAGVTVVEL